MAHKILVIDDEAQMVEMTKNRLETKNYTVITACNGQDGLIKAQREKPDLILLDVMMPNMDGGAVVSALKSNSSTSDIPVVFLTGAMSRQEGEAKDFTINVQDTYYPSIAKPFDSQELLNVVHKHINPSL